MGNRKMEFMLHGTLDIEYCLGNKRKKAERVGGGGEGEGERDGENEYGVELWMAQEGSPITPIQDYGRCLSPCCATPVI